MCLAADGWFGSHPLCHRRTWFLERVLKLGLVNIAKEYICVSKTHLISSMLLRGKNQCPTCPDPPACAKTLEDKWRQNYHSLFRFGAHVGFSAYFKAHAISRPGAAVHVLSLLAVAGRRVSSTAFDPAQLPDIRQELDCVL